MKSRLGSIFQSIRNLVHSIRFRLTLWTVIILAIVLASFSTVVYSSQARDLESGAINQLQAEYPYYSNLYVQAILPDLPFLLNGTTGIPNVSQFLTPLLYNHQFMVLLNSKGLLTQQIGISQTSSLTNLIAYINNYNQRVLGNPFPYQISGVNEQNSQATQGYVVLVEPIQTDRGGTRFGYLIMGEPIDPSGQLQRLLIRLVLISSSILLAAILGGYWLVGRALHPVKVITHTAREIGETDLQRRLNLASHDELGELADTFDRMLDRLEAAFLRQRQFTADASHELRTPLTIIDLESDRALSRRRTSEEYENALKTIKSENEFMTRLVNELLTLARMDAGQTLMKIEPLDLSDIVLDAVERLAPVAHQKRVELSTGDLPELKLNGDRQYLSQMVINLVENAIKYSTGDVRRVKVETGSIQNEHNSEGWLRVSDTGPGISDEHIPHLFDRFYRVDKARTRETGDGEILSDQESSPSGSGLGLSIVQWIVLAHKGSVTVHSKIGEGTTFEVRLPLSQEPALA
jgi:two-component system OmpR family sensor kinase